MFNRFRQALLYNYLIKLKIYEQTELRDKKENAKLLLPGVSYSLNMTFKVRETTNRAAGTGQGC